MKKLSVLCLSSVLCFCVGCTVTTYTAPGGIKFTRASLGTKAALQKLSVTTDPKTGIQTLKLEGLTNDQVDAAAAITEAAIRAVAK